jgi:phenylacetate-coenzyme A ligase PaaK-like adenylate-forming protein
MTQVADLRTAEQRMAELERAISGLLGVAPYAMDPRERQQALLSLLKTELDYACENSAPFANYVRHWPISVSAAQTIADLPYLPVSAFKANPPLSLVPADDIKRTLTSSSTSGQIPSRVVLDSATSRRMTKGVIAIIRDFIGSARRSYLVIDTKENLGRQSELGARGAAIQALGSFATEIIPCLANDSNGNPMLDLEKLLAFANQWKNASVLVYGFTHVIWTQFVQPLKERGIKLNIPDVHILHSGGWKRLEQQSVTKDVFNREVADIFGCAPNRIIDYYGMVENVGVVYPDCEHGYKHVPAFADVIVRDPLTLTPTEPGRPGVVQVCSVLPTSFPGFLLLTDDMGEIVGHDGCACGRLGTYFRFLRRVPKVEMRGCGNLETIRQRLESQKNGKHTS